MPPDPRVGHLDDPEQRDEEEHAEQQRTLRPQRVETRERGDGHERGAHSIAGKAEREPEREHGDRDADETAEHSDPERPGGAVEPRVERLGEPRLRDPPVPGAVYENTSPCGMP